MRVRIQRLISWNCLSQIWCHWGGEGARIPDPRGGLWSCRDMTLADRGLITKAKRQRAILAYLQIPDSEPMVVQCWATVSDGGQTLNHYRISISCIHWHTCPQQVGSLPNRVILHNVFGTSRSFFYAEFTSTACFSEELKANYHTTLTILSTPYLFVVFL